MVRAGSGARGRSGTMARGRFITFSPDGSVYEVYNWSGEGPPTQHEIDTLYRRLQLRPGEQQEP